MHTGRWWLQTCFVHSALVFSRHAFEDIHSHARHGLTLWRERDAVQYTSEFQVDQHPLTGMLQNDAFPP